MADFDHCGDDHLCLDGGEATTQFAKPKCDVYQNSCAAGVVAAWACVPSTLYKTLVVAINTKFLMRTNDSEECLWLSTKYWQLGKKEKRKG